jgi:hypothetical protein
MCSMYFTVIPMVSEIVKQNKILVRLIITPETFIELFKAYIVLFAQI